MSGRSQGQLGCAVGGCALKLRSGGYCSKHLREAREAGDVVADLRHRENRPPLADVVCGIDGCERVAKYRGQALCQPHYLRRLKRGTFDMFERPSVRQRLNAGIDAGVQSEDGCWLWGAAIADTGYGRIGTDYAHRVSYEAFVGPIPDGYQIDHLCRVRACVNPAHLEAVTQQENLRREAEARRAVA